MQPSISDYFRQQLIPHVKGKIIRESDEQLMGTDPEEFKQYYYQQYAWTPLLEDDARDPSYDLQDYLATIPAHRRERGYQYDGDLRDFQCQRVIVEVPIQPNANLREISQYRGDTFIFSYSDSDFQWEHSHIGAVIETKGYGFSRDEDGIAREVEGAVRRIREIIQYRNQGIQSANALLQQAISETIDSQRKKIIDDKAKRSALTQKISIPIKKKQVVGAHAIKVAEKPIVQRIKPKPQLPVEYVLDDARVQDIIQFLDGQAKNYEKTPAAIKSLGEENIRDLLLANLNSIFQGDATGETFSKNGKSDIYLKINKGNILICECKIWGGRVLYGQTIDQLRGYLTWRHNYGIMITFVRHKGITKVLDEAEAAIKDHPSYLGEKWPQNFGQPDK